MLLLCCKGLTRQQLKMSKTVTALYIYFIFSIFKKNCFLKTIWLYWEAMLAASFIHSILGDDITETIFVIDTYSLHKAKLGRGYI